VRSRLRRLGVDRGRTTQRKLYLLGARPDVNLKVRDGRLEVKRLVARSGALERWQAAEKRPLPLDPDWARRALPALLGVSELPGLGEAPLSLRALVLRVVLASPRIEVVSVQERRHRFDVGPEVQAEIGEARVSGLPVETAAVEGERPGAVRRVALRLGLDPSANTSWPVALRTLGLAPDGLRAHPARYAAATHDAR
jgi:hypothetical protein